MVVMAMASTIGTETIGWNGGFGWNNWDEYWGWNNWGWNRFGWNNWYGNNWGWKWDIQIIITTETMLITPAEEALLMQTITL
jgi:hypothetical protein